MAGHSKKHNLADTENHIKCKLSELNALIEDEEIASLNDALFGKRYLYETSESEDSTTSDLWQNKMTTTVSNLPSGEYRIGWYFETRTQDTGSSGLVRVRLNGTDISKVDVENKDGRNYSPYSGFYKTTDTDLTIRIDYKSETAGKTTRIKRARIEIWRIK